MNVSELKKLLQAGEWNDIEFKEARADVPKSAFETVAELDKEVDMASDLVKAMFGGAPQVKAQVEAHDEAYEEAHDGAHDHLSDVERKILFACKDRPRSSPDLLALLGYENRTGNLKKALARLRAIGLLDWTIPEKPRSKNQRYCMTAKGRRELAVGRETALPI